MGRKTTKQIKTLCTTPSKQNKQEQKTNSNKNQQEQKQKQKILPTHSKSKYSPFTHENIAENKLCNARVQLHMHQD